MLCVSSRRMLRSYVVLGNIYVKHDHDFPTAARFLTRALELKPGDLVRAQ